MLSKINREGRTNPKYRKVASQLHEATAVDEAKLVTCTCSKR